MSMTFGARRAVAVLAACVLGIAALAASADRAEAARPSATLKLLTPGGVILKTDRATVGATFANAGERTAYLQVAPVGSSQWVRVSGSTKATNQGSYQHTFTPASTRQYRVVLPSGSGKGLRISTTLGVKVVTGWRQVAPGANHTCALRWDRTAWCWGANNFGQLGSSLGSGTVAKTPTPRRVSGPTANTRWATLTSGDDHTCGRATTGVWYCWGANNRGQLGVAAFAGTTADNPSPRKVAVVDNANWSQLIAGPQGTCAITPRASLWCWGYNNNEQLGVSNATISDFTATPQQVTSPLSNVTRWKQVVLGESHTCGLLGNDAVACWGSNGVGQSGPNAPNTAGAFQNEAALVPAPSGNAWRSLGARGNATCGLLRTGTVRCWGINRQGQLASTTNFETNVANPTPLAAASPLTTKVKTVVPGRDHACAIRTDSALWCWGNNGNYQLARTTLTGGGSNSATPLKIGTSTWRAIGSGSYTTCALRTDHQLFCWGFNLSNQVGRTNKPGEVDIATLSLVKVP